jgi:predicted transcriptional regulator
MMNVGELMTREVVAVPPGASLKQAAQLLVDRRISGLPVVDDQNHVLGVLSEADLLQKEATGLGLDLDQSRREARLVGEAMSAPPLTIERDRPVSAAAALMIQKGVNRLPVVEQERLVGIVTRADLVRAFVRSDAAIASEIREDVVAGRLRLDARGVQVEVDAGEAKLSGRLENRADAGLLETLVAAVPGVVGVHSKLTWTDDDAEC